MLKVAIAQISPIFLNRQATLEKVAQWIERAAAQGCELLTFSETLVPGYPVWLDRTGGSRFDDADQKEIHALYLDQAVNIDRGDLDDILHLAKKHQMHLVLGVAEGAHDRGGNTIYCSCVVINNEGVVASVHRKLMPTYEERLSWGIGDGAGLQVHDVGEFRLGALNCWENWMPLARAALQAQGETLHVAIWPGQLRNTIDITKFMAKEGRSFVISASGLLSASDIPPEVPLRARMIENEKEKILTGGSVIAAPNGDFLAEPLVGEEGLIIAELDSALVRAERQNFDPHGHYSRPDVLKLKVNRTRQRAIEFEDSDQDCE